ncbi:MAG: helicase-related protein [Bryobacteraceae bacterium]
MLRLFLRVIEGWHPRLVDLPTGAAKTEVVVIWVIALAWYGMNSRARCSVPRRLVWVVNRRVLVQQVFELAEKLRVTLSRLVDEENPLFEFLRGLSRLSGQATDVFRVVQLRGQFVDDRAWSVAPTVPQLIIGTVDQIGSRLLFQGYGLGKWSRPLQAVLLAVDAWICVDEAHLVPAFVLTLRQAFRLIRERSEEFPQFLSPIFDRLPFWLTELSATPTLPRPAEQDVFTLKPEDEDDPRIADRLLAAKTRRVKVRWYGKEEKLEEVIAKAAAASTGRIAVFVREPRVADKVSKALNKQNKFKGRTVTITGRLRGYERDRLAENEVLKSFRTPRAEPGAAPSFLVGTAAAEVGLDADAARLFCDFASLPTLVQRLGRLDRRGLLSRRWHDGAGKPPEMTVFARRLEGDDAEARAKRSSLINKRIEELAPLLNAEPFHPSASLLTGTHWKEAIAEEDIPKADRSGKKEEKKKEKPLNPEDLSEAATWTVLFKAFPVPPSKRLAETTQPAAWLNESQALVAVGPVAVPPLTKATIVHWAGTTEPQNKFLPVHPFLYGILPEPEGTPLVAVAFRLELDALTTASAADDDEDEDSEHANADGVMDILKRFPLRQSELHFVPIATAREWLGSKDGSDVAFAYFSGDDGWSVLQRRQADVVLRPNAILVLPTAVPLHEVEHLLAEAQDLMGVDARDVLDGVSTSSQSYWRKVVQTEAGDHRLSVIDGAARFERDDSASQQECLGIGTPPTETAKKAQHRFRIGTTTFRFEYYKARKAIQHQTLSEHLQRAEEDAVRIASVLATGNEAVRSLLREVAKVHDTGKTNSKWQRAMGNPDVASPVAKPLVDRPAYTFGFRHEWESFLQMRAQIPSAPHSLSEPEKRVWTDLWFHLLTSHHGHLRPWLSEKTLQAHHLAPKHQSVLRLDSAERFVRLQRLLGPWRLAYLEALLKAADVAASTTVQASEEEDADEQ